MVVIEKWSHLLIETLFYKCNFFQFRPSTRHWARWRLELWWASTAPRKSTSMAAKPTRTTRTFCRKRL